MSETKENIFKIETSALRAYTMIAALALIWVYFHWATGSIFLTPRNLSNLMLQTSVTGIIAVGMLMVIIAGQIDLSVGSVLGFAGAVAAIALVNWELGLLAALLSAIIIGSLIGLAQGALTAYLNIPAFIVTLGGLLAWRGAVKAITQIRDDSGCRSRTFKSIGQSYIPATDRLDSGRRGDFVCARQSLFSRARRRKRSFELGEANYTGEMT
jgi:D-xylose transport system permease protein